MIPVARSQRHRINGDVLPKLQQGFAIFLFLRQGAPRPFLFVPVGVAVLFIAADHRSGGDGIYGGIGDLTFDPALVILFASEFKILGSKGTPCSSAIDVRPFVIAAIAFLPINPGFNFFKFLL